MSDLSVGRQGVGALIRYVGEDSACERTRTHEPSAHAHLLLLLQPGRFAQSDRAYAGRQIRKLVPVGEQFRHTEQPTAPLQFDALQFHVELVDLRMEMTEVSVLDNIISSLNRSKVNCF